METKTIPAMFARFMKPKTFALAMSGHSEAIRLLASVDFSAKPTVAYVRPARYRLVFK